MRSLKSVFNDHFCVKLPKQIIDCLFHSSSCLSDSKLGKTLYFVWHFLLSYNFYVKLLECLEYCHFALKMHLDHSVKITKVYSSEKNLLVYFQESEFFWDFYGVWLSEPRLSMSFYQIVSFIYSLILSGNIIIFELIFSISKLLRPFM